jgi:hypothetical protein
MTTRSVSLKNTPSIQHAVTLIQRDVAGTVREFEKLEASKIDFSYRPTDRLIKPLMEGSISPELAVRLCEAVKNPKGAKANAELVQAFGGYVRGKKVAWFNPYPVETYRISPDIGIPINPSGYWVDEGVLKVLWLQKWKNRTLDPIQRAILHTILDRRVFAGDDFSGADLEWVDLRAPDKKSSRVVEVRNRKDFGLLSDAELKAYLDILLEAFNQYSIGRARRKAEEKEREKERRSEELLPLFDGIPEPDR